MNLNYTSAIKSGREKMINGERKKIARYRNETHCRYEKWGPFALVGPQAQA